MEHIPSWIKKKIRVTDEYRSVVSIIRDLGLNTVCESAACPNIYECFGRKYATFMILGNVCTRACRFCGVGKGTPLPPDFNEADRIAEAVARLELRFVVVTSVTRDDLPDGGASVFSETVRAIRERNRKTAIEILIPDFNGRTASLDEVCRSGPDIISHNMETVPSLYASIRPRSSYRRSLDILAGIVQRNRPAKSGLMLGLGETNEEIFSAMEDVRNTGCSYLVLGQYLKPSRTAAPVRRYLRDEEFAIFARRGAEQGFRKVFAGTFFRTSYLAEQCLAD